jgi:hypothetical protein
MLLVLEVLQHDLTKLRSSVFVEAKYYHPKIFSTSFA